MVAIISVLVERNGAMAPLEGGDVWPDDHSVEMLRAVNNCSPTTARETLLSVVLTDSQKSWSSEPLDSLTPLAKATDVRSNAPRHRRRTPIGQGEGWQARPGVLARGRAARTACPP